MHQVSDFYHVKEEELVKWNTIRFINDIAFMKDKFRHDIEVEKERIRLYGR